jgi:transposase-like protein
MKKCKARIDSRKSLRLADSRSPRELIRHALRQQLREAMRGLVHDLSEQEVTALCGPRYQRDREADGVRAGSEDGSIYWDGRREPLRRPRVRDAEGEVHLEAYDALRDYDLFSDEVQRLLIRGVSTRDFSELTEKLDEDLPLSKSSASRAFQRSSQRDLDGINGRDLSGDTYCCLMIDGIEKAGSHVMVALGFTTKGSKKILGLREGATENSEVVKDLIQSLIDRGLCTTSHILLVLDGAKALRKAVKAHWGDRAIVQRCQEHKIRNVRGYLPSDLQDELERRMRAAYGMKTLDEGQAAMKKVIAWLGDHHEPAARSLNEGLEETLTVQRLGLPDVLRRTFRSANPIESLFDKVEYRVKRVKRWKGGNQVARWAASSLLLHETKFRRVRGYRQMHLLLAALENVDTEQAVA